MIIEYRRLGDFLLGTTGMDRGRGGVGCRKNVSELKVRVIGPLKRSSIFCVRERVAHWRVCRFPRRYLAAILFFEELNAMTLNV